MKKEEEEEEEQGAGAGILCLRKDGQEMLATRKASKKSYCTSDSEQLFHVPTQRRTDALGIPKRH